MSEDTRTVAPRRRSTRANAGQRRRCFHVSDLPTKWRRLYLDLDHCRLLKCIRSVQTATASEIQQLRSLNKSFLAMAIAAASAYGLSKEDLLLEYARTVADLGLNVNDVHESQGNSAVVLAAYHGYVRLLEHLLDSAEVSLDGHGMYGNAVAAAVRNGQHEALRLILRRRPRDAAQLWASDQFSLELRRAIYKNDAESVRILICTQTTTTTTRPTMSDRHMRSMRRTGRDRTHLHPLLRQLYPDIRNVACWSKALHWSFPTSDRRALNLLWHTAAAPGRVFPPDVWLLVFRFTGRGWFRSD